MEISCLRNIDLVGLKSWKGDRELKLGSDQGHATCSSGRPAATPNCTQSCPAFCGMIGKIGKRLAPVQQCPTPISNATTAAASTAKGPLKCQHRLRYLSRPLSRQLWLRNESINSVSQDKLYLSRARLYSVSQKKHFQSRYCDCLA